MKYIRAKDTDNWSIDEDTFNFFRFVL